MFDTIDMTDAGGVGTWIAPRHERDGHPSDDGRLVSRADRLHASIGAAIRELFALLLEIERSGAWEADGARDVTHWVQIRYGVSGWKAHRWVDAARALERLPQTAAALASGRLGVDKIVELTRFTAPESERGLLAWAGTVSSGAIRRRAELETRRPAEAAADADAERRLRWWFTDEGRRMELMAELPADAGAVVARAIDAVAEDLPEMPEGDRAETIDARRADALVALCDGAVVASARSTESDGVARTAHQKPPVRRIRPRIVVHAPLSAFTGRADGADAEIQVASGSAAGVIGPPTLRRLACDAEFQVVVEGGDGEPLHLGRTAREPSAAIARLVRHRDRECRFPACGASRFTEAHHVEWWSRGGTTDVSNLVLLCGFHHRLVHEHGWGLRRGAGGQVTWTRPDGSRFRSGPSPPS